VKQLFAAAIASLCMLASCAKETTINNDVTTNGVTEKIVNVDKSTQHINIMGNEMPPVPQFPKLSVKAGKVCGYVKDWTGKPLSGARIAVRSSYFAGYYSSSSTQTDTNGYYELTPAKGTAEFYNAGYHIVYSEGIAAVSLHPAYGTLESWTTVDGKVENFVLVPYGITSQENVQNNPQLPTTYYGGAIFLSWYGVEANDDNAPEFAIKEGTLVEITLTPEGISHNGGAKHSFVINKVAGSYGELRIHNIPLGLYRISIKANGKAVKIKDTRKYNPLFGLNPAEAMGAASIAFLPGNADASMITPQYGAWEWVNLSLERINN
jgi:hypothetical protein